MKKNTYRKILMCFARERQEKMIKNLEEDFYKILLNHRTNLLSTTSLSFSCRMLSEEIHHMVSYHYLDPDLVEYLMQLDVGIVRYVENLEEQKSYVKTQPAEKIDLLLSSYSS